MGLQDQFWKVSYGTEDRLGLFESCQMLWLTVSKDDSSAILSLDFKTVDGIVAAGTEKPENKRQGGDIIIWFEYSPLSR